MKKARVVCLILIATILFSASSLGAARGDGETIFERIKREHEWIKKYNHKPIASAAGFALQATNAEHQSIDVKHYRLQIALTPEPASIAGTVTINAEASATVDSISIDASDNLVIDGVRVDGSAQEFQRKQSRIVINFSQTFSAGRAFTIAVQYHGVPVTSGLLGGGMLVSKHGSNNTTVMANLSEPYAAPTWWPCVDDATDKATVEVEATVPENFRAASNGVLEKVEANANHTVTYFWREDAPLATYLVSVAAADYVTFEDSYTAMDGTRMPIVYYVYPEHEAKARQKFAVTRDAIEIFAPLFGEYPFVKEKYGMAEFSWSGGMEHQTMTSLGASIIGSERSSGQGVIAHELAHQWWGDFVTMKSWRDIWLNEGFASYAEVLFFERYLNLDAGQLMSESYDDGKLDGQLGGTVTAENLDNPFDDRGAIYDKGAWVLHMLRHILGDERFFAALKEYARRFAFGNAATADFQHVCEQFYGGSLEWFFQQWIYAPGRPVYKISTEISPPDAQGNYAVKLTIKQKQSHTIPGRQERVYIMPLDVTVHYADGSSEIRAVWNDSRRQSFTFTASKRPVDIGVDEGRWVLKKLK